MEVKLKQPYDTLQAALLSKNNTSGDPRSFLFRFKEFVTQFKLSGQYEIQPLLNKYSYLN